ncbi:MAG: two-component regulator propeller domain-containing protein [Bacteroidota bacterium]|nr:two-component regulator propeller domain-containing protein [Bacteroidota bacterium]MDP4244959.1 two-component regulator propeller domain-containing protein [Bacteroidota bacterium]MDP4252515.1 two-component regulator propeller domain-containing protein [Bacteroidota bacterium]MDP4260234.1 two-component regulator propeller domain-containing protein [Bacteroidota bacterium]
MRIRNIIWLCGILLFTAAGAQPIDTYSFRHISQLEGLVYNNVFTMFQDARGYVWIGTENGLQRYDGSRFVTYQEELSPSNKSHLEIGILDPIGSDRLFLSLRRKLDISTNAFGYFTKKDLLASAAGPDAIFQGAGDTLWILGTRFAYACTKGDTINAYSMVRDTVANQVWVAREQGLLLLDGGTKRIYSSSNNAIHHPLLELAGPIGAKGIMIDSRRNLWINTWVHAFYRYDVRTKKLRSYSLRDYKSPASDDVPLLVNQFFEDNHQQLWLATANAGLLRYDRGADRFDAITVSKDNSRGIQYNYEIFCLFQDREGNIWLGTDKGINIFNPYRRYFQVIRSEPNTANTLPRREIDAAIQTRQGDLLIGTWGGGMVVYDRFMQFRRKISFPGLVEENLIWCFAEAADGTIWIGCQHGYLHIYDPKTGKLSTLHPPALENSTVRCMRIDGAGNIFFGLHNGKVALWNRQTQDFQAYAGKRMDPADPFTPVYNIYVDSHNSCWAATGNGLKEFDRRQRVFTHVYRPAESSANACRGIAEENDSTLLLGLVNGGLAAFNTATHAFSFPLRDSRLAASTIHSIQKDRHGNTWFTTDYDLYTLNPSQSKYSSYSMEPGVVNSAFESCNFVALSHGRWLISSFTEALVFCPDSLINKENADLPVEITGMRLFDRPLFVDSFLLQRKPMTFSYKDNFLTIEFSTLQFSNIRKTKYTYKLSGVDRNWVRTELTAASYTNLNPGSYSFFVTTDDAGDRNRPAVFTFVIRPPFWQTWWFRLVCLATAIYLIYIIARRRIGVIRRELTLKRQMQEAKMMALRAQMNPHFIFNCINSIDALIQSNDKYQATVYLNKFAKLLRNILDSSKENTVPIGKDLETLELYIQLEQFRNNNSFTYTVHIDAALLAYDIRVPPLIVQPYVENAIQHGLRYRNDRDGKLKVDVRQQNGQLFYTVEDNGIGRELSARLRSGEKRSYGMDMSADRIQLFNKEQQASVRIEDLMEESRPAGTRVTVALKID